MKTSNGRQFRPLCVAAIFLSLAACTGEKLVNPEVTPPGSSVSFADGYTPGCLSGFADANRVGYENSYTKDVDRYASDPEYRAGWNQGHDACYLEEQRTPRMNGYL